MKYDQGGNFAPGELDRLLAEGEADIERGDLHDGDEAFRELDELSAALRSHLADAPFSKIPTDPVPKPPLGRRTWRHFTILLCIFVTGLLAGTLAGRFRARAASEARAQSPEGPEWGHAMAEVRLVRPTLREAIATLGPLSGAEIRVDWEALQHGGIPCDTPLQVDLRLHDVTLDQVLPLVVGAVPTRDSGHSADDETNKHRIGFQACDGMVCVSTFAWLVKLPPVVRVYDVSRLLAAIRADRDKWGTPLIQIYDGTAPPIDRPPEILMAIVTDTVAPDSWVANGGSVGTIACVGGKLVVLQMRGNQQSIRSILDQLVDQYETRSKWDPGINFVRWPGFLPDDDAP